MRNLYVQKRHVKQTEMLTSTPKNQLLLHQPILSHYDFGYFRTPGPGLGNLLLPTARAIVGSHLKGGKVVLPTMRQIKLGTFWRAEKDKRTYGEVFRARDLSEWGNWFAAKFLESTDEDTMKPGVRVITYTGLGRYFHDIHGYHDLVRRQLVEYRAEKNCDLDCEFDIAVHVRLGDFQPPSADSTQHNVRIPIDWYGSALKEALTRVGRQDAKCMLFTDADPSDVAKQIGVSDFIPEPRTDALNLLLVMAQAKVIIGSRSSFSLWGQYLGDTVAIWPKNFDLARYKRLDGNRDYFH